MQDHWHHLPYLPEEIQEIILDHAHESLRPGLKRRLWREVHNELWREVRAQVHLATVPYWQHLLLSMSPPLLNESDFSSDGDGDDYSDMPALVEDSDVDSDA